MTPEFNKEDFKKEVIENVKSISRKTIETASEEQIYQAVALAVKDIIMDRWIATHKTYDDEDARIL